MEKDPEKRFNAVMDKLFYAPKSTSVGGDTITGVQAQRGQKRPNMASEFSKVQLKSRGSIAEHSKNSLVSGGALQAPLCRPWDRGDLQKRLATFKSMTWFAKPQVVSAVNCAMRGWINVDSDIISCEACGSRLLFSTPSSWTQHQVEKAANVFSLKLDNGHKIFCPWVDNACDKELAQFPPTTSTILVDDYKKRYAALLQLSALPVISSSATDLMKNPQLDDFIKESSNIKFINMSSDASSSECLGHESQNVSSPYYQALKLVSLCGWEFRLVPYFVDYSVRENSFVKDVNLSEPSSVVCTEENPSAEAISEPNKDLRFNKDPMAASKQYDPSSIVLDCRLCGASVGLWAFSTTPRPVEYIRLVGEVNGEIDDAYHKRATVTDNDNSVTTHNLATENANDISKTSSRSLVEVPSSLNLTIAGGPSPAKQNFVPTISLPVIGQNLRARFSSNFESRPGDGQSNGTSSEQCLGTENNEQCYTLQSEDDNMLVERPVTNTQIMAETDKIEFVMKDQSDNSMSITQSSSECLMLEEAAVIRSTCQEDLGPSQLRDSDVSTSGGNTSCANDETSMNDSLMMVVCAQRAPGSDIVCSKQGCSQEGDGTKATMQAVNSIIDKGLDMKQSPLPERMEFDPIRQHRHFCPWITSTGSSLPGWKQTLSALQRQKEFSSPSSVHSPSSLLIEVDDPVASIKKLFMSPSPKRAKLAHK
ncbi:C3HC-type domain-containing protein [Heracleum sosnowskyi]|uniref:C3HC-type domain-containing protein n=1 Tax=Heracleum sosnowskyi TaxID=360622 RepID=A0AAD8IGH0_9APIA|nr:C3HC-type domain-containing protein [Heracleum sosnowskyi]